MLLHWIVAILLAVSCLMLFSVVALVLKSGFQSACCCSSTLCGSSF